MKNDKTPKRRPKEMGSNPSTEEDRSSEGGEHVKDLPGRLKAGVALEIAGDWVRSARPLQAPSI